MKGLMQKASINLFCIFVPDIYPISFVQQIKNN